MALFLVWHDEDSAIAPEVGLALERGAVPGLARINNLD
jgi:hypothetical protein